MNKLQYQDIMQVGKSATILEVQTVVKLCGNKEENIENILQNIDLNDQQHDFISNVLMILYKKIERLRNQRNLLKKAVEEREQDRKQLFQLNEGLKLKIQQMSKQKQTENQQDQQIKGYECSFDGSNQKVFQTPPFKQVYMSAKIKQNKENMVGQIRSVSAFESSGFGRQAQDLMKKYNLTQQQFKQVIKGYAQEQRKRGEKFLVDSQKKLYLQNTRLIKIDEDKQNSTKRMPFQKVKINFIK